MTSVSEEAGSSPLNDEELKSSSQEDIMISEGVTTPSSTLDHEGEDKSSAPTAATSFPHPVTPDQSS